MREVGVFAGAVRVGASLAVVGELDQHAGATDTDRDPESFGAVLREPPADAVSGVAQVRDCRIVSLVVV